MNKFVEKIFNFESKTISGGAVIIAFFYLLNGLIALLRNGILAYQFGASRILDIYWASFRVPDLIYVIFISGALSAGFIPFFAEKLNKSKEEAWQLANNILSTIILVLFIAALLILIVAPLIVKLIVPGFDVSSQKEVAKFLRVMMFQPIFLGASAIFGGMLQTFRRFFVTSLSPIFYNLGIIIGAIFLTKIFGPIGLAIGVLLGAFLHLAVLFPSLKSINFRFNFLPSFKSENIKNLISIAGPRTLSLISTQINFLVITIIASHLEKGSLAIFNFANDLHSLPQNIFAISFAISAFPILATLSFNAEEFSSYFIKTLKNILFFLLPAAAFYFIFRQEIIFLTLKYGQFDLTAQKETSLILGIFSFNIIFAGLLPLLIRVFFAQKDAWRPFLAGLSANILNVFLSLVLAARLGIKGIAISFVISNFINLVLLIWFIKRKNLLMGKEGLWLNFKKFFQKIILATIADFIFLFIIFSFLPFPQDKIIAIIYLISGGAIFVLIYLAINYFLMKEELIELLKDYPLIKKFVGKYEKNS
ncbi:MAG: murein biosynthesis integral membrane protein MurJ [Minisyncoccia bacterium]